MTTGCGLLVGGVIGYAIYGIVGAVIGAFAVGLVGAIIGAMGAAQSAKKPPIVRIDDPPSSKPQVQPAVVSNDDVAARLRRLDELREQGLLSDQEHRDQRASIIGSI